MASKAQHFEVTDEEDGINRWEQGVEATWEVLKEVNGSLNLKEIENRERRKRRKYPPMFHSSSLQSIIAELDSTMFFFAHVGFRIIMGL